MRPLLRSPVIRVRLTLIAMLAIIGACSAPSTNLFDPATIIDRATYREPTLPPLGLRDVVVNGVIVVRDGAVKTGVLPGRGVRGPIR